MVRHYPNTTNLQVPVLRLPVRLQRLKDEGSRVKLLLNHHDHYRDCLADSFGPQEIRYLRLDQHVPELYLNHTVQFVSFSAQIAF